MYPGPYPRMMTSIKPDGFPREVFHTYEQKHRRETLYDKGRVPEARDALLELTNIGSDGFAANELIMNWVVGAPVSPGGKGQAGGDPARCPV